MILQKLHSPIFNKAARCVITVVLTVAMMIALVPVFSFDAFAAYETKYGTITISSGYLNVRASANSGGDIVGKLRKDDTVTIVGEETDSAGTVWYKIEYISSVGEHGYVSSKFVTLTTPEVPEVDPDEGDEEENVPDEGTDTPETGGEETDEPLYITDFEAWMEQQGFPEDYKDGLRALHEKYPNWVFKADHIKYDWETILAAQMKLKVSLVENTFPSSWKSTQAGAYDWEKSEWIPLDGTRWVQASREIIEHYLDPRNFLDSNTIFQFLEQGFDEDVHTLQVVQSMLKGTFMAGNLPDEDISYAQLIFDVSKENDVNPCVIASMILIEQGTTGSALCSGKYPGYEGYYNYFNYNAYGTNPVASGLAYAKTKGWNSARKSITAGIESFAEGYVSVGQSTLYYKRFDFVGDPFTHQYSQSVYIPKVEGERAAKGYTEEMRQATLTFTIPVYTGMPETACVKPTGDGSPNIKLSSLTVEGFELTPEFMPDTLEYTLVVPAGTSSVNITAVTMDTAAKTAGAGKVELPEVENTVTVTVTAENGDTRDYVLTIAKEAPEVGGIDFSGNYAMSGTYIMAAPGTTVEAMTGNLLNSGSAIITLSGGSSKEITDILMTGDKVLIYDENDEALGVYVVCVIGDVTGDGKITSGDCIKTRNHMLNKGTLEGVSFAAADVTGDGKIMSGDVIKIRNHMLGKSQLS